MSKIGNAIGEIHRINEIATRDQWMNRLHPLVKFVITIFYIVLVISFPKYDFVGLLGMFIYPLTLFLLADLSFPDAVKRVKFLLPLLLLISLPNPILDKNIILLDGLRISGGVLSMLTLLLKGIYTILASYLLIATTTMESICYALRLLHVPKIIVTQILLSYRYLTLLLEEVNRITQAYALRAPKQKGIHYKAWGSLTGQLLLRSMDHAETVYEGMLLRGFNGEYNEGKKKTGSTLANWIYLLLWLFLLTIFRICPVLLIVGKITGGIFS